jgi:hypothetical protein
LDVFAFVVTMLPKLFFVDATLEVHFVAEASFAGFLLA